MKNLKLVPFNTKVALQKNMALKNIKPSPEQQSVLAKLSQQQIGQNAQFSASLQSKSSAAQAIQTSQQAPIKKINSIAGASPA